MSATAHRPGPGSPVGPVGDGWRDLADGARHANPFDGPDMLGAAMRRLGGTEGVRLLRVDGPDAAPGLVVPVATRRRHRRLPYRVSTTWQHTHHFLGTPLLSPGFGVEQWRDALDRVAEWGDPVLVLTDLDVDVARDVEEAAHRAGRVVRRIATTDRPVTRRHAADDYLAQQLSGSRRKELRRVRRRLDEALGGGLALVDRVAQGRTDDGIETFLRLEAAGWKGTDGGAIARNPDERAFFAEACRGLAEHGGLEILSLEGSDATPVAMAVNLLSPEVLFTFKIAYDERFAAYSPGLLLSMEQLTRFHESGRALLDTCAAHDHPMASRLHADRRALVSLAVGLRGRRGDRLAAAAPHLLSAEEHARRLLHGVRHRASTLPRSTPRPA